MALIDTDSDPDVVDLPIPGNDDSIRSIELIVQQLADAVLEGRASTSSEMERQKGEPVEARPVEPRSDAARNTNPTHKRGGQ